MCPYSALKVGVLHWQKNDDLIELISSEIAALGCQVTDFYFDAPCPSDHDLIFAFGPFGSLVPLATQLCNYTDGARPRLVLWICEGLPNPFIPEWIRFPAGSIRSSLERIAHQQTDTNGLQIHPRLRWLTEKGFRYRYYGDLFWLQKECLTTVLAVGSQWYADFLRARGLDPVVAYYGLREDPAWGIDLKLERDIPVLWIGKQATRRRKNLLSHLREELAASGIDIYVVDGVERPYVFGKERTELLNRSSIVINVLRQPWDNNSVRFYLAALNGALLVSEPVLPHLPFVDQKHYIETPLNQMAEIIHYYLSRPDEVRKITANARDLMRAGLTIDKSLPRLLAYAMTQDQPMRSLGS